MFFILKDQFIVFLVCSQPMVKDFVKSVLPGELIPFLRLIVSRIKEPVAFP